VNLKRVAHRPRDGRPARNNQRFASEAEHRVALSAISDERHNESRAVTFNVKVREACTSRGEGCGLLCAPRFNAAAGVPVALSLTITVPRMPE